MWMEKLVWMKKQSGQTTEEISSASGVPVGTLNKIFAGQTKAPQLETVKSVVYALGFRLDDLFDDAPAPEKIVPDTATSTELRLVRAYFALSDRTRKEINDALADVFQHSQSPPTPHDLTDEEMHAELSRQLAGERESREKGTASSGSGLGSCGTG